ncbi:MAG: AAA family ATPase, partial [Candidatus Binatia bacterium]
AILSEGIHRFEGTINQFTGDGVMALFGAPIAHEDHAHRACYAALHLTQELAGYAAELRRNRGLSFSVRMGLNSGEVVVGKIGDDLRMDYTAQGRTVGLAARMEQLAAPDKVYLTDATAQLVSGYFRLADLGGFTIKGVRNPVRVFDLQGTGPMRTRLEVSRARGFSRLVGRDRENRDVETTLAEVLEGRGRVLGFVGEAGVGKSRLTYEFVERCRARGIPVHAGHCVAHGKSVPFLPVLEFLRSYFGITERDADGEARKKIAGTLVLLDEGLRESLAVIFDFLGVADPDHPPPRMDPDARKRQLFDVIRRVVHARSRRQPLVVVFEDLHWMDGGTEGYVRNLVDCL